MKSKRLLAARSAHGDNHHGDRRRRRHPAGPDQRRSNESGRGSQLRGRAHGDRSFRGRQALGLRGDSIPSAARRLLVSNLCRRKSQWRARPRHREWNRFADYRRRTARLPLHWHRIRYPAHVTGIDPGPFNTSDPVQIGSSTLLSFSPTGSSTSGTLFMHGIRGNQFAVRVLGATGRTRILEFNFALPHGWPGRPRTARIRAGACAQDGRDGTGPPASWPHRTHRRSLVGWRAHRNGLAPAARHAGRDAGGRPGAAVSRRRPHPSLPRRAASIASAFGIAAH